MEDFNECRISLMMLRRVRRSTEEYAEAPILCPALPHFFVAVVEAVFAVAVEASATFPDETRGALEANELTFQLLISGSEALA